MFRASHISKAAMLLILIIVILFVFLLICERGEPTEKEVAFNSGAWKSTDYPNSYTRLYMMSSLKNLHLGKGLSKSELIKLLGEPEIASEYTYTYFLGPNPNSGVEQICLIMFVDQGYSYYYYTRNPMRFDVSLWKDPDQGGSSVDCPRYRMLHDVLLGQLHGKTIDEVGELFGRKPLEVAEGRSAWFSVDICLTGHEGMEGSEPLLLKIHFADGIVDRYFIHPEWWDC